jgi:hypothetical protein
MCLPNTNEERTERKSQSTKEFFRYFLKNASKKGAVSKGKQEEWKCYQNEKCLSSRSHCIENSSISSTVSIDTTVSVDDDDSIDSTSSSETSYSARMISRRKETK